MQRITFVVILVVLFTTGCFNPKPKFTAEQLKNMPLAQRTELPDVSGGLVLSVDGQTLTADEIALPQAEHFKTLAKSASLQEFQSGAKNQVAQVVISKVSNILLYKQAKKNAGDIDDILEKEAEKRVREFVISFGNDYSKAEDELKKMGMDWDSFRDYQKKTLLSQSYLASKLPDPPPVTYSDLMEHYNSLKDNEYNNTVWPY